MPTGVSGRQWRKVRDAALQRDGYRCQIQAEGCTGTATTGDHITPVSRGGAHLDLSNIRAACATCNASRGPNDW